MEANLPSIYSGPSSPVTDAETARMRGFQYPNNAVSQPLLGPLVAGSTVLDVGAGPSTLLGQWVNARGGDYTALDIRADWLQGHTDAGHRIVNGSVLDLPMSAVSIDVVHMRFVLMHQESLAQRFAVCEVLRVAKRAALFVEYDWGPLGGTAAIDAFKQVALAWMSTAGIQPSMGSLLPTLVRKVLPLGARVDVRLFPSGELGDYTDLCGLALSMRRAASDSGSPLASAFAEAHVEFSRQLRSESPAVFDRIGIVTALVTKSGV